jgi:DNA primase
MPSREEIALVRERANIVDLIARYTSVRKAGKNFLAVCPFHPDKNPSLTISPEKNLFHCFGCGEGGDLFKFLMQIEKISFPEAVERIASELGIKLSQPERGPSPFDAYRELNEKVCRHFQKNLKSAAGRRALDYLKQRGFTPETIEKFRLGYALGQWDDLLRAFPLKEKELLQTLGLLVRGRENSVYDRFRDRLIFPIFSSQGEVIGFAGRALDGSQEPKYLNISNTPLFEKSQVLYGLHLARASAGERQALVLVEGYTDVIAAHQAGIPNVVASMGTALTTEQAQMLKRFAPLAVLAYDRDAAGQAATLRGMRNLRNEGLEVQVAVLPPGEDPDSLIRTKGAAVLEKLLSEAVPFHRFYLETLLGEHDLRTLSVQESVLREASAFIQGITSVPLRYEMIRELSGRLRLPEEEIARAVQSAGSSRAAPRRPLEAQKPVQKQKTVPAPETWGPEEHLLYFILQGQLSVTRVTRALEAEQFVKYPEIARALYEVGEREGWHVAEILERLSPEDQATVTRLSLAELNFSNDEKAISDNIAQLKMRRLEEGLQQLKAQLAQAERAGDTETTRRLSAAIIRAGQERRMLQRLREGGK